MNEINECGGSRLLPDDVPPEIEALRDAGLIVFQIDTIQSGGRWTRALTWKATDESRCHEVYERVCRALPHGASVAASVVR